MEASSKGHAEVVGALLAKGADVEAKNNVSMAQRRVRQLKLLLVWCDIYHLEIMDQTPLFSLLGGPGGGPLSLW